MKKFFKIVLWVVIAIVFIGTFVFLFLNSKPKVTTYALVSPTDMSIERTTVLTGKIEPRDEIDIKPQISGIISEINVEPGDMVHAGDVIARIKVIPEASSLSSAQSRVENAKIALDDATAKYERNKTLFDKKIISREEFETSETSWKQAAREVDAANDAYMIVRDGVSKYNASESNTMVRSHYRRHEQSDIQRQGRRNRSRASRSGNAYDHRRWRPSRTVAQSCNRIHRPERSGGERSQHL